MYFVQESSQINTLQKECSSLWNNLINIKLIQTESEENLGSFRSNMAQIPYSTIKKQFKH